MSVCQTQRIKGPTAMSSTSPWGSEMLWWQPWRLDINFEWLATIFAKQKHDWTFDSVKWTLCPETGLKDYQKRAQSETRSLVSKLNGCSGNDSHASCSERQDVWNRCGFDSKQAKGSCEMSTLLRHTNQVKLFCLWLQCWFHRSLFWQTQPEKDLNLHAVLKTVWLSLDPKSWNSYEFFRPAEDKRAPAMNPRLRTDAVCWNSQRCLYFLWQRENEALLWPVVASRDRVKYSGALTSSLAQTSRFEASFDLGTFNKMRCGDFKMLTLFKSLQFVAKWIIPSSLFWIAFPLKTLGHPSTESWSQQ